MYKRNSSKCTKTSTSQVLVLLSSDSVDCVLHLFQTLIAAAAPAMAWKASKTLGALLFLLVVQCATAASWEPFMSDGCPRPGFRLYTASLIISQALALPFIAGQRFACPNCCVSDPVRLPISDVIGIFLVSDPAV